MPIRRLKRLFHNAYTHNLLATNITMSGGLLFLGDVIQQNIELHNGVHITGTYDWPRSGRMLLLGLFHGAPRHFFYQRLETLIPGRSMGAAAKKVFMDEALLSVFIDSSFLLGMGLLEGRGLLASWDSTRDKFPQVYLWDWLLWPPVQLLNFTLVPLQFRVLFVNLMNLVWNTVLSYAQHDMDHKKAPYICDNKTESESHLTVLKPQMLVQDDLDLGLLS